LEDFEIFLNILEPILKFHFIPANNPIQSKSGSGKNTGASIPCSMGISDWWLLCEVHFDVHLWLIVTHL